MFRHRLSPSGPFLDSGLLAFACATGPAEDVLLDTDDATPILTIAATNLTDIAAGQRLFVVATANVQQALADGFVSLEITVTGITAAPVVSPPCLVPLFNAIAAGRGTGTFSFPVIATQSGSASVVLSGSASAGNTNALAGEASLCAMHIQES